MEQKKGLTLSGMSGRNFVFILNAAAMIGVSIYLTSHFYDVRYPTQLDGGSSLCDISSFFNCDTATFSKVSNLAGIPISFFGIIVGLLFLFASLMPSEGMERTASAVSKYNFIGCVVLFLFSLIALGSLCPFCTVYYVLSGVAAYLFWKYGKDTWKPDSKSAAGWAAILLIGAFVMYKTTAGKEEYSSKMNASVLDQFKKLPDLGEADVESPFKLHLAGEKFSDAPIRISVFSDFECPFCKIVSTQMHDLIRKYPKQVSIQYFFYPLDNKCNSNMNRPMHQNACDAASLAACDVKKFVAVHDDIFANQEKLRDGALNEIAKRHELTNCIDNPAVTDKVVQSVNQAAKFNLKSTPTIIINGRKIEGTIPNNQFFAIFDEILKDAK
jgi:protein-disulfide isomerase/uncharacterized membrane protein